MTQSICLVPFANFAADKENAPGRADFIAGLFRPRGLIGFKTAIKLCSFE
jgi:hypothetical protein